MEKRQTPKRFPSRIEERRKVRMRPATISRTSQKKKKESRLGLAQRQKLRRKRRIRSIVVLFSMIALTVAGLGLAFSQISSLGLFKQAADYPGPGSGHVTVEIPEGSTGTDIGVILEKNGVVASVEAFTTAFKSNSRSQGIQAGAYNLPKKMSAAGAVAALLDPAFKAEKSITIPEGLTVWQVKERIENVGDFDSAEIEAAFKNSEKIGLPKEAGGEIEGWIYPDTYSVNIDETPESLLKKMVAPTVKLMEDKKIPRDQWQTVLIKASILEREVNIDKYYPMVARVIENRLDNPSGPTVGKLDMDSTVLYGVGKSGGIPTEQDMKDDNPYNTYVKKGLPPTPIGAVSEIAIDAVLHPAAGDWFFYTTVNLETGETKFAKTLDEQNKLVQELRKYCDNNPGVCK